MFVCVPDWSFKCTLFLWQTKRILLRPWILDAKESPKTALFLFGKKESVRTHLHLRWRQKCNSKVNFRKWMRTPTHSPGNFCHVCKLPTKRCYFTPITNFVTANIVNDFPTTADHISKYGRFLHWWGGVWLVSCIIIYKMAVYTIVTECSSFLIIVRMKQTLLKSSAVIVNNTAFIDKWFSFGSHLRVVVHLNWQQQNTVPIY